MTTSACAPRFPFRTIERTTPPPTSETGTRPSALPSADPAQWCRDRRRICERPSPFAADCVPFAYRFPRAFIQGRVLVNSCPSSTTPAPTSTSGKMSPT